MWTERAAQGLVFHPSNNLASTRRDSPSATETHTHRHIHTHDTHTHKNPLPILRPTRSCIRVRLPAQAAPPLFTAARPPPPQAPTMLPTASTGQATTLPRAIPTAPGRTSLPQGAPGPGSSIGLGSAAATLPEKQPHEETLPPCRQRGRRMRAGGGRSRLAGAARHLWRGGF